VHHFFAGKQHAADCDAHHPAGNAAEANHPDILTQA